MFFSSLQQTSLKCLVECEQCKMRCLPCDFDLKGQKKHCQGKNCPDYLDLMHFSSVHLISFLSLNLSLALVVIKMEMWMACLDSSMFCNPHPLNICTK